MGEHEGVSSSSPGGAGTTGAPRDPGGVRGLRGSRGLLALAGLVAGVAGIAVSHTVTMLLTIRATPLLAVAEAIIEITPGRLAEGLIALVGQYDKPLLIVGVSLGVLALSAWAGVLSARSRVLPMLVFLAMGAIAVAAVWTRPGSSVYDVLPVVAGTATWVVVLGALTDRLTRLRRDQAPDQARDHASEQAPGPRGSPHGCQVPSRVLKNSIRSAMLSRYARLPLWPPCG